MRTSWEKLGLSDAKILEEKEKTYKGSWKQRGGVGAFMMLARKWDRLENICEQDFGYDVFAACEAKDGDDSAIEQLRDLRRYLLLVEAELIDQKRAMGPTTTADIMRREAHPFGYDQLIEEGIFDPEKSSMVLMIPRNTAPVMEHVLVPFGALKHRPLTELYDCDRMTGDWRMKKEFVAGYGPKD